MPNNLTNCGPNFTVSPSTTREAGPRARSDGVIIGLTEGRDGKDEREHRKPYHDEEHVMLPLLREVFWPVPSDHVHVTQLTDDQSPVRVQEIRGEPPKGDHRKERRHYPGLGHRGPDRAGSGRRLQALRRRRRARAGRCCRDRLDRPDDRRPQISS